MTVTVTETETPGPLPPGERRPMLHVSIAMALLALLGVLPMPSTYYDLLRVAVVAWALLTVVHTVRSAPPASKLTSARVWPFVAVAVGAGALWFPYWFTFEKQIWVVLDVILAAVAAAVGTLLQRTVPRDRSRWPAAGVTALTIAVSAGTLYLAFVDGHADRVQEQRRCAQLSDRQQRAQMTCAYDPRYQVEDQSVPGSGHYAG